MLSDSLVHVIVIWLHLLVPRKVYAYNITYSVILLLLFSSRLVKRAILSCKVNLLFHLCLFFFYFLRFQILLFEFGDFVSIGDLSYQVHIALMYQIQYKCSYLKCIISRCLMCSNISSFSFFHEP